jgi:hypothetical protein
MPEIAIYPDEGADQTTPVRFLYGPGTGRRPGEVLPRKRYEGDNKMTSKLGTDGERGSVAGISLGGILVIVGIVLMFVSSFWIGLIVTLIGLVAFGGFAKGKWY